MQYREEMGSVCESTWFAATIMGRQNAIHAISDTIATLSPACQCENILGQWAGNHNGCRVILCIVDRKRTIVGW